MEATPATQSVVPAERQITVSGLRTPVLEAGPAGATEAVVCLHGNPGFSQDFKDLIARAGTFARALAFDMPGYGHADKPREFDFTTTGYARFFGEALDSLGVERAHLVLHDLGGPWAMEWAAGHAERVASVVLLNTGALIGYRWHVLARVWRRPVLGEIFMATANRTAFRVLTNRDQKRKLSREFLDQMYDAWDRDTRRAVLKHYRSESNPDQTGRRHAAQLRRHDLPALVVWGARDPYLGVELAEAQRQAFPSARVVVLDDSGHWPFIDNPEEVAAHVVPFLRDATGNREED
jgi:pimeloyl-ACP methyl ester carboxylesterase